MRTFTPRKPAVSARITSPSDRLPVVLWTAAVLLTAAAACWRPAALLPAARATLGPFATLAAIIAGSVLAGRLGVFDALARLLIPGRAPRAVAAASVLAFTALLSGLVNLDVAVIVAMPVALRAAGQHRIPAAALHPAGPAGLWAAILAAAVGPDLLITGSVATLICRRVARHAGATLGARQFTAIGSALIPAQLAAATLGLHITGALR